MTFSFTRSFNNPLYSWTQENSVRISMGGGWGSILLSERFLHTCMTTLPVCIIEKSFLNLIVLKYI